MNYGMTMKRIKAIETRLDNTNNIPVSIVRMKDGEIRELYGLSIVPVVLEDGIEAIATVDADIAGLCRALNPEVKIEIVWLDGDKVVRRIDV